MKKLAIIGAGDLGQQIAYHVEQDKQFKVVGFFDDFAKEDSTVNNINVIGKIDTVKSIFKENVFDEIIIGIGYKHLNFREKLYSFLKNTIPFATFIHSSCFVDASCNIGAGVCVLPASVLDRNVEIANNVFINLSCTIAHDSKVEAHSFLSPRVAIAGFVTIGKRCNIGINTTIIDNVNITDDVQTGGGSVIINSITNSGLYVGNPSRFIR